MQKPPVAMQRAHLRNGPQLGRPAFAARPDRLQQLRAAAYGDSGASEEQLYRTMAPPGDLDDVVEVKRLGADDGLMTVDSPFARHNNFGGGFVDENDRVALSSIMFGSPESSGASDKCNTSHQPNPSGGLKGMTDDDEECVILPTWAVRAGARKRIVYEPVKVHAAIVTCGGLCPGLNDVVQGIVKKLTDYGVPRGHIKGIRYGFRGFYDKKAKPVVLTNETVEGIHFEGGTILGTSRGGADLREIVKRLDMWGIDMLFVVGGNGGNAGANAIQQMCEVEGVCCTVVGIPKSIDNDILMVDRCFGFDTAVEEAQRALQAAKVEASSARNGIGLVKLMGRSSGFITLQASLASGVVDVCLIPEVPFELEGDHGMLTYIEKVLRERGHCVVCVAEGAGQTLLPNTGEYDPSGNPVLADIGKFLKSKLKHRFAEADIKFIDPTYMIRAIPTTSNDRLYCKILAHNAVHAAFAGFTGITVGLVNTHYVYLPIEYVIRAPRTVDPKGKMWNRLRASIGQPAFTAVESAFEMGDDDPFDMMAASTTEGSETEWSMNEGDVVGSLGGSALNGPESIA